MKLIDISWPITTDMTTYKDSKVVKFEYDKTFEPDGVRESTITLNSHTGTHIDAPAHFLQRGETVELVALEHLVGPCRVLDLTAVEENITADDLKKYDLQVGQRKAARTPPAGTNGAP